MSKIRILDAEFKCLTCGQKIKLAHMKCVREKRKETAKEFLKCLNRINKIVVGGCPKVNVITEIFEMKKKWEKEVKEIE